MKCISRSLQLWVREFIHVHEFQNLAMMLLMTMKEVFLANVLMMKKHHIEWKLPIHEIF